MGNNDAHAVVLLVDQREKLSGRLSREKNLASIDTQGSLNNEVIEIVRYDEINTGGDGGRQNTGIFKIPHGEVPAAFRQEVRIKSLRSGPHDSDKARREIGYAFLIKP